MKLRGKTIWLTLLGGGVLLVFALALLARGQYPAEAVVEREFNVDVDFTRVRKILVRTDAARQIVTMGGQSEFLAQDWSAVGAELESIRLLDPGWKLELHGTLRVRTLDEYIGRQEVVLRQEVRIDPNHLTSEVSMKEPSERLLDYAMTTRFQRDEMTGMTVVTQKLRQRILTDAPWFAHGIANRRVRAAAQSALEKQERAILQIVSENLHQRWLLPLR